MTQLERMSAWWRRTMPVAGRRIAVVPVPQPRPRVPAEYLSLYTYLERRYASTVVLTFAQIESLLGFALPAPARNERAWWTDQATHTDAWRVAKRTATPNLSARTVTFERRP